MSVSERSEKLKNALTAFNATGSPENAIDLLRSIRDDEHDLDESINLGRVLCEVFPRSIGLIRELCLSLYKKELYSECYFYHTKTLQFGNLPEELILNFNLCINHIHDLFISYNKTRVDAIINRPQRRYRVFTLSITTCKRIDLFEKTMNSFINCCQDVLLIDDWICVDDNSISIDRDRMKELYPFMTFYFKEYSEKGHARSMNLIRRLKKTPYVFHLEDDWKFFCPRTYIGDCLDVLTSDKSLGQCLVNKNYSETDRDIDISGGIFKTTQYGTRYYEHEYAKTEDEIKRFNTNHPSSTKTCYYWPHFSLRPGLWKSHVIDEIGEFSEAGGHFEMEYAHRYVAKGYKTAFLESIYTEHIGKLTSDSSTPNAYKLNNETQFVPPPVSFRLGAVYINLDRRPDRNDSFLSKRPKEITFNRISAIDGDKLKPSVDLCRLFEFNDYNMRSGMVGCALTHIQLYIFLLQSVGLDGLLILEDDVEFAPRFASRLDYVIGHLPEDFDIVYVGNHPRTRTTEYLYFDTPNCSENPSFIKRTANQALDSSFGGTFGYIISKKGATALLKYINDNSMTNGIDTMAQKAANVCDVYYLNYHLVKSEMWDGKGHGKDSDIQTITKSLSMNLFQKLRAEEQFYKNIEEVSYENIKDNVAIVELNTGQAAELLKNTSKVCYRIHKNMYVVAPVAQAGGRSNDRIPLIDGKMNIKIF